MTKLFTQVTQAPGDVSEELEARPLEGIATEDVDARDGDISSPFPSLRRPPNEQTFWYCLQVCASIGGLECEVEHFSSDSCFSGTSESYDGLVVVREILNWNFESFRILPREEGPFRSGVHDESGNAV